jgi:uncharacterized repeat protein (TIGR01451 family)
MVNFIARLFVSLRNRKQRKRIHRRLRMECMETRALMANDLGIIAGTVFTDRDDDGFSDPRDALADVAISGATIQLFLDSGLTGNIGVFDNSDTVVGTDTTDGNGAYQFDDTNVTGGVIAGTYHVRQTAVAGRLQRASETTQTVTVTALEAAGTAGTNIDNFDTTPQTVTADFTTPSDNSSVLTVGSESLGGERDILVNYTSSDPAGTIMASVSGGLLSVSPGFGSTGTVFVTLDGTDGDATTINNTNGLSNFDLTNGGTDAAMQFKFGSEAGNSIEVTVYSTPTDFSTFTQALPDTGAGTEDLTIRFADFVSSGNGADFTNVNAIQFQVNVVASSDAQFDFTQTVGQTTKTVNFANLNPMSLGNTVFLDVNNNGSKQVSETGISGVTVELYEDTDLNGDYTDTIDTLIDTATTDSSGNYLFTDLFPGEYVGLIPISQFSVGQPLFGHISSLEPAAATLPNTDTDDDDNGELIATIGVATAAITLASGAEPTSDGDSNTDSNLTLDFGFAPQIDLVVEKTVNVATINAGSNLTYTLAVRNDGPSAATDVVVVDDLPTGVTIVSATSSVGTVTQTANANGEVSVAIGTLNANANATITIVVTVPATAAAGTIDNSATITGLGDEPDTADNTDSVGVTVTRLAVLTLSKSDVPDPVVVGGQLTYTILVTNTGPSTATNVDISDTLPAGLTFGSVSTTAGTASEASGVITATIPTLSVNGQATITVISTVLATFAGTTIANSATAEADEAALVTANSSTAVNKQIDLQITKSHPAGAVIRGNQLVYTLNVINKGPSTATNVEVIDTLPAGLTFVSATGGTVTPPSNGNQTVIVNVGTLADEATATVTITVTVDQSVAASVNNTAEVRSTESLAGLDLPTNNNTVIDVTNTSGAADLRIDKTGPATAVPGTTITYSIVATNDGPTDATQVSVADNLPDGIQVLSATSTVGTVNIPTTAQDTTSANNEDLVVTVGALANDASATITITALVLPATRSELVNVATVSTANSALTDATGNNSDTLTTTLSPTVDLRVQKTAPTTIVAGNQLTYTMTVTNVGPSQATNVRLTDVLPAGVTFVSGSSSVGTASVTAETLTSGVVLGTMNPGASETVTVVVSVTGATRGSFTNTATVTATEPEPTTDPNPNTASAVTSATGSAVLEVTQTDNVTVVAAGGTLTYVITIRNTGPSTATNIVATNTLPTGATFTSGTATNSGTVTNAANVVTANIASLASGATATVTIVAAVGTTATGSLTNSVSVDSAEPEAAVAASDTTSVAAITSMSGRLFRDVDRDNVQDSGDRGIAGVDITLTGTDTTGASVNRTVQTNSSGDYSFANTLSGTYTISRPASLGSGSSSAGTSGGTAGSTSISNITLGSTPATANNFSVASSPFSLRKFLASTPADEI